MTDLHKMDGLRKALPRKTRLRLRVTGYVDGAAYWLICHDRCPAAIRLWRTFGMGEDGPPGG